MEGLSQALAHELHLLVLDAGALGLLGHLLHVGALVAEGLVLVLIGAASALGIAGEEAVNHEVGIAADGAGEVGVVVESQSVVADVVGAVAGLHHGTQGDHLHDVLFAASVDVGEEAVQVPADFGAVAGGLQLVAELGDEGREVQELLRVGIVMDAIGQHLGLLSARHTADTLGHGAIGQQHEFLDELVGILGHLEIDALGMACLVDFEAHFLAVEVHGSGSKAASAQLFGHAVQDDELLGKVLGGAGTLAPLGRQGSVAGAVIVLGAGLVVCLEHGLNLLVGEASVAADDGVGQVPVLHLGLGIEVEDDAVGELLLVGAQGADVVAQPLGQHGDGAVHEIDARAALECFAVDDAALGNVV